jgi:hypothetical protein
MAEAWTLLLVEAKRRGVSLQGRTIQVVGDCQPVLHAVRKGTSSSRTMFAAVASIRLSAARLRASLTTVWAPSALMTLTDDLSRPDLWAARWQAQTVPLSLVVRPDQAQADTPDTKETTTCTRLWVGWWPEAVPKGDRVVAPGPCPQALSTLERVQARNVPLPLDVQHELASVTSVVVRAQGSAEAQEWLETIDELLGKRVDVMVLAPIAADLSTVTGSTAVRLPSATRSTRRWTGSGRTIQVRGRCRSRWASWQRQACRSA